MGRWMDGWTDEKIVIMNLKGGNREIGEKFVEREWGDALDQNTL